MKGMLTAALLLPAALLAQGAHSYTINGRLSEVQGPAKVYLVYRPGKQYVWDSAEVNNGVFQLKGAVVEPVAASLQLRAGNDPNSRDFLTVYLEKAVITITGTNKLGTSTVTGGESNGYYAKLQQMLEPLKEREKAMNAGYAALSKEELKKKREADFEAMEAGRRKVYASFINAHPNTIVSLDLLDSYGGLFPQASDLEPLYNKLSPAVKETAKGKAYAEIIARLKRTEVGQPAPDFVQHDADGKPVKLSDYRGKYVLLDFWASWCKPCRAENPSVVKAYNQYREKNFTVLGVSLDIESGRAAWLKAVKDDHLTWTQLIDLDKEKASDIYHIQAIPQNFLIDPAGRIIAKNLRGEELAGKLAEILH